LKGEVVYTACVKADKEGIKRAAAILREGGLVAFPTETVYGLGANALSAVAVSRIFDAKGRPADNPLIVHIPDIKVAHLYGEWNELADTLAKAFWPGPLTLVVNRNPLIPNEVSAGLQTVALRAPSHPAAQALLRAYGLPVAAPSANRSGRPSPTSARHVLEDLEGLIPLILDGGSCEVGLESTVADVRGSIPLILRPGAVTPEMITMACGECQVAEIVMRALAPDESAPSPGMRHRHYAPAARMSLVDGSPENVSKLIRELAIGRDRTWVLAMEQHLDAYSGLNALSLGRNATEAAHRLFHLLRQADEEGVERILSETLPRDGLGLAVMNRLARAADFDILNADLKESQHDWTMET
jgi:L-threonylcarbamoyladenylate synthase